MPESAPKPTEYRQYKVKRRPDMSYEYTALPVSTTFTPNFAEGGGISEAVTPYIDPSFKFKNVGGAPKVSTTTNMPELKLAEGGRITPEEFNQMYMQQQPQAQPNVRVQDMKYGVRGYPDTTSAAPSTPYERIEPTPADIVGVDGITYTWDVTTGKYVEKPGAATPTVVPTTTTQNPSVAGGGGGSQSSGYVSPSTQSIGEGLASAGIGYGTALGGFLPGAFIAKMLGEGYINSRLNTAATEGGETGTYTGEAAFGGRDNNTMTQAQTQAAMTAEGGGGPLSGPAFMNVTPTVTVGEGIAADGDGSVGRGIGGGMGAVSSGGTSASSGSPMGGIASTGTSGQAAAAVGAANAAASGGPGGAGVGTGGVSASSGSPMGGISSGGGSAASGGAGGGGGGGGGGCCFIMLEARYGDGTMDSVVRRYRDEKMTDKNRRGYYKLAEVFVPLMRESKLFKFMVTKTFADPLVSYGKYHYGENKHGWLFKPVEKFWMKVFNTLGSDTKFIRENGEVV
jgi:hypothetical protein